MELACPVQHDLLRPFAVKLPVPKNDGRGRFYGCTARTDSSRSSSPKSKLDRIPQQHRMEHDAGPIKAQGDESSPAAHRDQL